MVSRHSSLLTADMLALFPMCTGFPRLGVLQGLRPIHGHQSATDLPSHTMDSREIGRPRTVPVFNVSSIGQVGVQLYSGSLATPTPQSFDVASSPTSVLGFGVDSHLGVTRC